MPKQPETSSLDMLANMYAGEVAQDSETGYNLISWALPTYIKMQQEAIAENVTDNELNAPIQIQPILALSRMLNIADKNAEAANILAKRFGPVDLKKPGVELVLPVATKLAGDKVEAAETREALAQEMKLKIQELYQFWSQKYLLILKLEEQRVEVEKPKYLQAETNIDIEVSRAKKGIVFTATRFKEKIIQTKNLVSIRLKKLRGAIKNIETNVLGVLISAEALATQLTQSETVEIPVLN